MARDRLLPLSILTLAAAVTLHGVAPALAHDAPEAAPVAPAAPAVTLPVARPAPACRNLRVGTAKEVSTMMEELQALGHHDFLVVGTGILCGWS